MPVVVTEDAINAAGVVQYGYVPKNGMPRAQIKQMIEAALPHLTDAGEPLAEFPGLVGMPGSPTRQDQLDRAYLDAQAAVQRAAELQADQVRAQADFIAAGRALINEQTEVAQLQREDLAGATWRQAVMCAAEGAGSPTEDDGAHESITADAEWFAHLLGTPPVVF